MSAGYDLNCKKEKEKFKFQRCFLSAWRRKKLIVKKKKIQMKIWAEVPQRPKGKWFEIFKYQIKNENVNYDLPAHLDNIYLND